MNRRHSIWFGIVGATLALNTGCIEGAGRFLAPIVQPALGQSLSATTGAVTNGFVAVFNQLFNQVFGVNLPA